MQPVDYSRQHRGDAGDYERYLSSMDASMRQKVALTAAHLLCEGRVADMGMGSGAGSEALASLYPALEVVGVDVSETMVELARARYRRPNLEFRVGDIARPVFAEKSLDGIFDSSVLHHVTSFNGYDRGAAARALEVQLEALREHGVLIVRDFLDPGPGEVLLDLPEDDGEGDDPERCSTAALFERFAREFRILSGAPGFPFERADDVGPERRAGFRRFRVRRTLAAEFLLRKDYRADWAAEVMEEYTFMTQAEFEALFARLGLRVLASTPLWNPWIVRNRFTGRCGLHSLDGEPLEPPATNYIVVGEKVPPGEGVRFEEGESCAPLGFLSLEHFRDVRTGEVRDLVRRPHRTVDVLPWFEGGGAVYVLARMSYPRPILAARTGESAPLDGVAPAHYVTEPLNVLEEDKPLGLTVEEALARWADIGPESLLSLRRGARYFPSPGGILEEVQSAWAEVAPVFVQAPVEASSGFSTSGRVRAIEACQLLRAAQVGGLPDARLEQNVYGLLLALKRGVGPWIGEVIALGEAEPHAPRAEVVRLTSLVERPPRRRFARAPRSASTGFLDLACARFLERDARGEVIASRPLEFVVPRPVGPATVACALLRREGDDVLLGVDDDDLPAAQCFDGSSALLVAPAWRLPRAVRSRGSARGFVEQRLAREYGVRVGEIWELGGRYHPSPGATPEVVHPLAVQVLRDDGGERRLTWISLREALTRVHDLCDGHLRTLVLRAGHSLGLLT